MKRTILRTGPSPKLSPEERREFLALLARLTPEQRRAVKEVLRSFLQ